MNATPEMLAAFEAWRLAELASHYACPCPDDVMDGLVDQASAKLAALNAVPAVNADDLVLKMFPLLLCEFEPMAGNPPLCPRLQENAGGNAAAVFHAMMGDLVRISPTIADAIRAPHRLSQGGAQ